MVSHRKGLKLIDEYGEQRAKEISQKISQIGLIITANGGIDALLFGNMNLKILNS